MHIATRQDLRFAFACASIDTELIPIRVRRLICGFRTRQCCFVLTVFARIKGTTGRFECRGAVAVVLGRTVAATRLDAGTTVMTVAFAAGYTHKLTEQASVARLAFAVLHVEWIRPCRSHIAVVVLPAGSTELALAMMLTIQFARIWLITRFEFTVRTFISVHAIARGVVVVSAPRRFASPVVDAEWLFFIGR